jgi:hypothetical protein
MPLTSENFDEKIKTLRREYLLTRLMAIALLTITVAGLA